jgi:hypothetical protein
MNPTTVGPEAAGIPQLENLFSRILNISVGLAFIALTIMLVWAGIKFITSGGDAKVISSAWSVITWALLGMFFLILAWLIILLIKQFTGVDVTTFSLQFPQ